jgi:hypothetical protein
MEGQKRGRSEIGWGSIFVSLLLDAWCRLNKKKNKN